MQNEIFKTRDFSHSIVLLSLGYRLLELEQGGGNFVRFVFEINPEEAAVLWDQYWRKEIQVDAKTLIDSIHELKSRMYGEGGRR